MILADRNLYVQENDLTRHPFENCFHRSRGPKSVVSVCCWVEEICPRTPKVLELTEAGSELWLIAEVTRMLGAPPSVLELEWSTEKLL